MPLGREVGLGPCDNVLEMGNQLPHKERGTAAPTFRPMSIVNRRSPISATAELLLLPVLHGLVQFSAGDAIDSCSQR